MWTAARRQRSHISSNIASSPRSVDTVVLVMEQLFLSIWRSQEHVDAFLDEFPLHVREYLEEAAFPVLVTAARAAYAQRLLPVHQDFAYTEGMPLQKTFCAQLARIVPANEARRLLAVVNENAFLNAFVFKRQRFATLTPEQLVDLKSRIKPQHLMVNDDFHAAVSPGEVALLVRKTDIARGLHDVQRHMDSACDALLRVMGFMENPKTASSPKRGPFCGRVQSATSRPKPHLIRVSSRRRAQQLQQQLQQPHDDASP